MNAMFYKGYGATVEFDAADQILVGRLVGVNDVVGFHAGSGPEFIAAFHEAVDDYLQTCAKAGKSPDKPYSGKLMLRVDPGVHAQAALAARTMGKSLNSWGEDVLRDAAARMMQSRVQDGAAGPSPTRLPAAKRAS